MLSLVCPQYMPGPGVLGLLNSDLLLLLAPKQVAFLVLVADMFGVYSHGPTQSRDPPLWPRTGGVCMTSVPVVSSSYLQKRVKQLKAFHNYGFYLLIHTVRFIPKRVFIVQLFLLPRTH